MENLEPLTLATFYDFMGKVLKRPGTYLGNPSIDKLEAYVLGLVHGSGINFDESRLPLHHFLNKHFGMDYGSQVLWTSILKDGTPGRNDAEKIKYLDELWPQFQVWLVMEN